MNSRIKFQSSFFLQLFSYLLNSNLYRMHMIYTVFEPEYKFVNQAIFICFTLWNVVEYVYAIYEVLTEEFIFHLAAH